MTPGRPRARRPPPAAGPTAPRPPACRRARPDPACGDGCRRVRAPVAVAAFRPGPVGRRPGAVRAGAAVDRSGAARAGPALHAHAGPAEEGTPRGRNRHCGELSTRCGQEGRPAVPPSAVSGRCTGGGGGPPAARVPVRSGGFRRPGFTGGTGAPRPGRRPPAARAPVRSGGFRAAPVDGASPPLPTAPGARSPPRPGRDARAALRLRRPRPAPPASEEPTPRRDPHSPRTPVTGALAVPSRRVADHKRDQTDTARQQRDRQFRPVRPFWDSARGSTARRMRPMPPPSGARSPVSAPTAPAAPSARARTAPDQGGSRTSRPPAGVGGAARRRSACGASRGGREAPPGRL